MIAVESVNPNIPPLVRKSTITCIFDYNIFLIAQKSKNNSQRVAVLAATTTDTPDLSMAKKTSHVVA